VGGNHRDAHVTVGGRSCRCWHFSPSPPAGRGSRLQCTTAGTASSAMSWSRCSCGSTTSSRGDWLGACRVATLIHPVLSQQRSAEGLSATEMVTMLEHRRVPPRYLTNRMEQGTAMAHGTLDGSPDRSVTGASWAPRVVPHDRPADPSPDKNAHPSLHYARDLGASGLGTRRSWGDGRRCDVHGSGLLAGGGGGPVAACGGRAGEAE
jgi:hypothetical protein